jgi:hypothetical protein
VKLSPGILIALMMEAARTSETLVNFYQTTRCYNPEDSNLLNLKVAQLLYSVRKDNGHMLRKLSVKKYMAAACLGTFFDLYNTELQR